MTGNTGGHWTKVMAGIGHQRGRRGGDQLQEHHVDEFDAAGRALTGRPATALPHDGLEHERNEGDAAGSQEGARRGTGVRVISGRIGAAVPAPMGAAPTDCAGAQTALSPRRGRRPPPGEPDIRLLAPTETAALRVSRVERGNDRSTCGGPVRDGAGSVRKVHGRAL